jgi:hypothetical protein
MSAVSQFLPQKIHKELFSMPLTKADMIEILSEQVGFSNKE